ncbi:MAG: hypothetical protein KDD34_09355 [Bdellovibrionales bacterium]|nr:hypothetical protein [Bdellovibrionales bacterium]
MTSVTQITQFLYSQDPQQSLVRLTLYHYLKNACEPGSELNSSLLKSFFDDCLQFQFWQERINPLKQEILSLIQIFKNEGLLKGSEIELEWIPHFQVLHVDAESSRRKIIEKYLSAEAPLQKHQVLPLENNKFLALSLLTTGGLQVRLFSPFMKIHDGLLVPLKPLADLEYTSFMELMPGRQQILRIESLRTTYFTLSDEGYFGRMTQGHLFKSAGTLQTREISSFPELFYAIKSLEKFFIDPQTDPFYQELVDQLEKVYHLLSSQHPEGYKIAPALLKKGQSALRNIFHRDKLLLLLLNNIEYMLNKNSQYLERNEQKWQNARPLPK